MTLDEAKKVAMAASFADGGCPICVSRVMLELAAFFPEFEWVHEGLVVDPEEDHEASNFADVDVRLKSTNREEGCAE